MLKINNVTTYMTEIGQRIGSPLQQVAGIGWSVNVYPRVIDNVTYLKCALIGVNGSKWTAWVDATFQIAKENGGGFGKETILGKSLMGKEPLKEGRGCRKFVTSEELLDAASGFVVDDSVEIRVDFSVTDVCGASFNVFETDGALAADIKLKVGDSVFYANKGYLSVVSSAFRDTFALTDAAEDKKDTEELELKDLDASEFKEFLGVIYPTCFLGAITDANVISLFRIANRYDVKHVMGICERHLYGDNSVSWLDKLKLAADLNRDHLQKHLISEMTCDNIRTIDQDENKEQLGTDVLQALLNKHIDIHHL